MKGGEKLVLGIIAALFIFGVVRAFMHVEKPHDEEIPFYTTASTELSSKASELYHRYECRDCHSLWSIKDITQSVPAPMLDGIGSLRDEAWFYNYLSAPDPQSILPTRLKKKYQMPSYANLPEQERKILASYLASLKVKDWYLEQTKLAEQEKLTGKSASK